MIKNFFKVAFRNFIRNKSISLINIFGLAMGLATFILIFLFIQHEISYDKFLPDSDQVYRIEMRFQGYGEDSQWAATQGHWIPLMLERYPEIETGVKIMKHHFPTVFRSGEKQFTETRVFSADSTFFDVFPFKILKGDHANLLNQPGQIVITETTAKKYFGEEDPIGRTLETDRLAGVISGVCEDVPENSHFHFDILNSMETLRAQWPAADEAGPAAFHSYLKLKNSDMADELTRKANADVYELSGYSAEEGEASQPEDYTLELKLKPVESIHLHSHQEKELETNGNFYAVIIFATIALFVLIIACINYMNLMTARSTRRAKEVGVRKINGAVSKDIFTQFMAESFLTCFISILLALVFAELLLPYFNDFTDKGLEIDLLANYQLILILFVTYLVVGFLSGFYPSLMLSRFNALIIAKENVFSGRSGRASLYLRRTLVIVQFFISIALIISAVFVHKQLNFISSKSLGFDKDQVLVMPCPRGDDLNRIKTELNKRSDVLSVSACDSAPGDRVVFLSCRMPGLIDEGNEQSDGENDEFVIRVMSGDVDIVQTLGLEILQGRAFSLEFPNDENSAFILNEAAVRELGLEDPLDMDIEYTYNMEVPKAGKIVGVVKDFHYASLHTEIEPLVIHIFPPYFRRLLVKINPADVKELISNVRNTWEETLPGVPFDYYFLDTSYDNMYKAEMNLSKVVTYFTVLAIIIACLGLIGLASFIAAQRTKEIAVRKILGASIFVILRTLSKEFIILILISNILAWIPAYLLLNRWLQEFVFKIQISWIPFVVTTVLAMLLSVITVSLTTIRVANANPVDNLRYE